MKFVKPLIILAVSIFGLVQVYNYINETDFFISLFETNFLAVTAQMIAIKWVIPVAVMGILTAIVEFFKKDVVRTNDENGKKEKHYPDIVFGFYVVYGILLLL